VDFSRLVLGERWYIARTRADSNLPTSLHLNSSLLPFGSRVLQERISTFPPLELGRRSFSTEERPSGIEMERSRRRLPSRRERRTLLQEGSELTRGGSVSLSFSSSASNLPSQGLAFAKRIHFESISSLLTVSFSFLPLQETPELSPNPLSTTSEPRSLLTSRTLTPSSSRGTSCLCRCSSTRERDRRER